MRYCLFLSLLMVTLAGITAPEKASHRLSLDAPSSSTPLTSPLGSKEIVPSAGSTSSARDQSDKNYDLLFVLDNSGSMRKNDPLFLARFAVRQFLEKMQAEPISPKVGVILFDDTSRLLMPLTALNEKSAATLIEKLEALDYRGQFTDIPGAIEKAIYELKHRAKPDSKKAILFMTDGVVDTGNRMRDVDRLRWLTDDLTAQAAQEGIVIYAIAFSEKSDFHLIQKLSKATSGEYYRVIEADKLSEIFMKISEHLFFVRPTETVKPEKTFPSTPTKMAAITPPPLVVPEPPLALEQKSASFLMTALVIVLLGGIAIVFYLILTRYRKVKRSRAIPSAFITDLGSENKQEYPLGDRPMVIGRSEMHDSKGCDHIVIPSPTVGRRHAVIKYHDHAFWITDRDSVNGTFVNNQAISTEQRLRHGDVIRLHKHSLRFSMLDGAELSETEISATVFAKELNSLSDKGRKQNVEDSALSYDDVDNDLFDDKIEDILSEWDKEDDNKKKGGPDSLKKKK